MKYQYEFQYLKCQSCTAKIHCDSCGEEVRSMLLQECRVTECEIDMKGKFVTIDTEFTEEELLDELEKMGVFV